MRGLHQLARSGLVQALDFHMQVHVQCIAAGGRLADADLHRGARPGRRQAQLLGGHGQGVVEAGGVAHGEKLLGVGAGLAGTGRGQVERQAAVVQRGAAGTAARGGGAGLVEDLHGWLLLDERGKG